MLQITIFKDKIKKETTVAIINDLETSDELASMNRETGLIDFSVLENHIGETVVILIIDITNGAFTTVSKEEKTLLSIKPNSDGIMTIEY